MNEDTDVLAQHITQSELDNKYLIFRLAQNRSLFSIRNIKEIIKRPEITPAPNLPDYYLGYFKLRNDIIPIISMRKRLGHRLLEDENAEFINILKEREQDHLNWLNELRNCVVEGREFKLQRDPHKCAFGIWKDSFQTNSLSIANQLRKFDEPHSNIHKLADIVLEQAKYSKDRAIETIEQIGQPILNSMIKLFDEFYKLINDGQNETVIIFFEDDKYFGILVDGVEKIIKLLPNQIDSPPDDEKFRKFLKGFGKSDDQFYLIYDEFLLK